ALAAAESQEPERVRRNTVDQLRLVVAAREVARAGAAGGAVDAEAVVLGAERGRDEVELRQAGRGAGEPAALRLLELLDHLGQLRAADVRLDQRARGQLAERIVVGRLVGERLVAALEDRVDMRLAV